MFPSQQYFGSQDPDFYDLLSLSHVLVESLTNLPDTTFLSKQERGSRRVGINHIYILLIGKTKALPQSRGLLLTSQWLEMCRWSSRNI